MEGNGIFEQDCSDKPNQKPLSKRLTDRLSERRNNGLILLPIELIQEFTAKPELLVGVLLRAPDSALLLRNIGIWQVLWRRRVYLSLRSPKAFIIIPADDRH